MCSQQAFTRELRPGGFARRALVITGTDAVVAWSHEAGSLDDLPVANLIFDGLRTPV